MQNVKKGLIVCGTNILGCVAQIEVGGTGTVRCVVEIQMCGTNTVVQIHTVHRPSVESVV